MTKEKGPGVAVVVAASSADKNSMGIKTVEVEKSPMLGLSGSPRRSSWPERRTGT